MQQVPVKIKLFDPSLPVPAYQTAGAAAFDLYTRIEAEFQPGQACQIPTNVAIQLPEDFWLMVASRSSLYKRGLQLVNGVGVIDADFCGNDDEIQVMLRNFSDEVVRLTPGERIAQGIIIPRTQAQFTLVPELLCANRGGFGSTGIR